MATDIKSQWKQTFEQGRTACSGENFADAEQLLNRALNLSYDEGAPEDSVAEIFFSLGWCYHAQKKYVEAQRSYGQALATFERCRGTSSIEVAEVLQNLGSLLCETGRVAQAKPLFDRAFIVIKRTYGESNPEVIAIKSQMEQTLDFYAQAHSQPAPSFADPPAQMPPAPPALTGEALATPAMVVEPPPIPPTPPSSPSEPLAPPAMVLEPPPIPPAPPASPSEPLAPPAMVLEPPPIPPTPHSSASEPLAPPAMVLEPPPIPPTPPSSQSEPLVPPAMVLEPPPIPPTSPSSPSEPLAPPAMVLEPPPIPPALPEPPTNIQFFDMVERSPQTVVAPESVSTQYFPPPLPAKQDRVQQPAISAASGAASGAATQQSPASPPEKMQPQPFSASAAADTAPQEPNNKIHAPLVQGAYYTQAESSTPREMPPLPIPSKGALPPEPGSPEAASERGGSTPKRRLPRAFGIDDTEGSYDDMVSQTSHHQQALLGIDDLVHPREKFYGTVSSIFGWLCFGLSFLFLFGLVIAPVALVAAWISGGICKGHLRAHSIKISENQFPEVHEIIQEYSEKLGIKPPQVYVCHYDGVLNAFTNRFQQRDYITISSDVFEMAYQQGLKEIAFVICHELAHVKRGHVKWAWLHTPASFIPFFGSAYSRSCEYTCDRIARYLVPDGALFGLVALAAGTKLYKHVNLKALYQQQEAEWDFWTWFTEIESSHPNLLNRIRAIGLASERDAA